MAKQISVHFRGVPEIILRGAKLFVRWRPRVALGEKQSCPEGGGSTNFSGRTNVHQHFCIILGVKCGPEGGESLE